ncbi:PIN-like domain-containing protein [Lactobacillus sp. YT155]|uniref:PIN-like domain-containing protein n=1 Tax=Lactobacillus sp. YT155 TaxID=3060955 RepID=UPI00265EFCA4|nr:PIN-like domain-containing protein [Lactobacillus sp. YT155]MDO1604523.1 PIN-like domain-containing protein [Lactobacillus sp. YT155]
MNNLKELFPEFYRDELKSDDLSKDVDNIIVLDTNFLLDVIQLPTEVAKNYIKALVKAKDSIYIPYLVALEFNFNKSPIKRRREMNIEKYKMGIDNSFDKIKQSIENTSLININNDKDKFYENMVSEIEADRAKLNQTIDEKIKSTITNEESSIYDDLIEVISDRVGDPYTQEWIDEVEKDGDERYSKGLPPGYNDSGKEDGDNDVRTYGNICYHTKYGDLIIWKDIIRFAKDNSQYHGKKVIYVTDDGKSSKKNDLLFKVGNKTVGPKIHLLNEMNKEADKELYVLSNLRFIRLINALTEKEFREMEELSQLYENLNIRDLNRNKKINKLIHEYDEMGKLSEDSLSELRHREKEISVKRRINLREIKMIENRLNHMTLDEEDELSNKNEIKFLNNEIRRLYNENEALDMELHHNKFSKIIDEFDFSGFDTNDDK